MNTPKQGRTRKAKMQRERTVSYRVFVIGLTWAGYSATYTYDFEHSPTAQQIKAKAGDFQSLTDYAVHRITNITTFREDGYTNTKTVECVKVWNHPDSDDTFRESQNN